MMTNIKKLSELGILSIIRFRLSGDETDDSFDDEINSMTPHEIVSEYAAYELGDASWWNTFKDIFDDLESVRKHAKI
jgi:hypothetical protein